ncbi:hypothetical protein OX284_002715 [Flavobacterium sp. SUN046]|uniref:hypothetical protein n=1 Tax=Flavobacterium sp. SUN046 TaxID=3002440 RepID=UPI002DB8FE0C|nr:hypothetical protein [Flavobacterium sp. SUN046]MEC4048327.1 hypothetical protein [Flavobacterium sp. SUN046]
MTELQQFEALKAKVLLKYQEHFPFFQGNWKSFSSQDIQNLIALIEEHCKQSISEKWIYTHLKPEAVNKLPRKDMLNILAQFVGYSAWDEWVFEHQEKVIVSEVKAKSKFKWSYLIIGAVVFLGILLIIKMNSKGPQAVQFNNEFTKEKITNDEVKIVQVIDSVKEEVAVVGGKAAIKEGSSKLIIKSPFYKTKTIQLTAGATPTVLQQIELTPDDYPMMLKAFMLSDIKDWQVRKEQLNKILSNNLEVVVMLKDNLGAEYFDKKEFAQQLIIPTPSVRKMKIIAIEKDADQKIKFIRITQE